MKTIGYMVDLIENGKCVRNSESYECLRHARALAKDWKARSPENTAILMAIKCRKNDRENAFMIELNV